VRRGFRCFDAVSLAAFIAAFFFAGSFLLAQRMTQIESSADILVMLSIFCTLALLPGAIYVWRAPTLTEVSWLALVAVFATAGHYAMTRAIAAAPLTVTQPLSFLQLIWAIAIGYWVFDEVPDNWVIIGASIIVAAVSYLTHREAQAARRSKLKAATTPASPG